MERPTRTPGGAKNEKSGKDWSKEELREVLEFYLYELKDGKGIHESNPVLIKAAKKLGRETRTFENQLRQFKGLEKNGENSTMHIGNNCKEVWKEHMNIETGNNDFLIDLLDLQQDGKKAISAQINWSEEPLLHVEAPIDKKIDELAGNMLLGKDGKNSVARWFFLIGSPGNGKSAAIGSLVRKLKDKCEVVVEGTPIDELDPESKVVPYELAIYESKKPYPSAKVIQDASVVREPFDSKVDAANDLISAIKEAWEKGISLVVCSNRGVIEKAYNERYLLDEFKNEKWFQILKQLVKKDEIIGTKKFDGAGKKVFGAVEIDYKYLDSESLLINSAIFDELIKKGIHESNWGDCDDCRQALLCPFKSNRDWLSNEDARQNFLKILRRAEVYSGQVIVFREAIALISLILAGCTKDYMDTSPCEWVRKKNEEKDIFSLAMRRIYMNLFSSYSGYGLEISPELNEEQKKEFKELINLAEKEEKFHLRNILKHLLASTPPSTDVGLGRLIGHPEGVIPKIDAWNESLNGEFQDKWNQELTEIKKIDTPLFTNIEKNCVQTWQELENLIEESSTDNAPEFFWALKRWYSNFLLHFGETAEGLTRWATELDEYIDLLEVLKIPQNERKPHQGEIIQKTQERLKDLLTISEYGEQTENTIPLSSSVELSGHWVSFALSPKLEDKDESESSLFISIKFQETEQAKFNARTYIWLSEHSKRKLDSRCLPQELLLGISDARIRSASTGKESYSFELDRINLIVSDADGSKLKLNRYQYGTTIE